MSEWLHIETAPKDGREIIYRNSSGEVSTCRWDAMDEPEFSPGWYDPHRDADVTPAHWMPLPPDPLK